MGVKLSVIPSLKMMPVASLNPYEGNARTHSDEQVAQIAASIREFGFTNPVLVGPEGRIIAGHGRVLAAQSMGMADVPTIELGHLDATQRRAYVIADNKLALNAGWDIEALKTELSGLRLDGFNLAFTGFSDEELADLLAAKTDGLTDPDEVLEVEPAISVLGDVWQLGRHRITCGDATNAGDVARVLAGVSPHLMVTDPPYGVNYDADWRNRAIRSDGTPIGAMAIGPVNNDDRADWSEAWALFPGDVAYVWHGALQTSLVLESLSNAGLNGRALIIWAKQQFVISRGHYHNQHEPCWYVVRDGATGHWAGDRKQSTLWQIDKPIKSETGHSTQKPVECMKRPIENNSSPGQAVYDPFSGSGTTIIAAEMTGRCCYAIELNPVYVDVAVRRWQKFTGKSAILESDGRNFDEIKTSGRQANIPAYA